MNVRGDGDAREETTGVHPPRWGFMPYEPEGVDGYERGQWRWPLNG